MCPSTLIFAAVFLCLHARSGYALSSTARLTHIARGYPDSDTQALIFSHHKTGTVLSEQLADILAPTLHGSSEVMKWMAVNDASRSLEGLPPAPANKTVHEQRQATDLLRELSSPSTACAGGVRTYEDMRVPLLEQMLEVCPGTRAVHMVRRPSSCVVSNYVYTKGLEEGDERASDFERQKVLNALPLSLGMRDECERFFSVYANQMLSVHKFVLDKGLKNILEVRFEDITTSYDNTTRSIFEHFLGSGNPAIEDLVTQASAFDIHRMPEDDVGSNRHISSNNDEEQAAMELRRMYEAGDTCAVKLLDADKLMGYTD